MIALVADNNTCSRRGRRLGLRRIIKLTSHRHYINYYENGKQIASDDGEADAWSKFRSSHGGTEDTAEFKVNKPWFEPDASPFGFLSGFLRVPRASV